MDIKYKSCDNPECYNMIVEHVPGSSTSRNFCSNYCVHYLNRESRVCTLEDCASRFTVKKSSKQRHCSRECSSRSRSKTISEPDWNCKRCTTPIKRTHAYCTECWTTKKEWSGQERADTWLSGDASVVTQKNGEITQWAKNYLVKESNDKCTRCGWCEPNPTLGRPILTVDHIDGNWKNNHRNNLVVLCPNCHSLTPTYCSLNRGSISGTRPSPEGSRLRKSDRVTRRPREVNTCHDCEKEISPRAVRCSEHDRAHRGTKIEWPTVAVLVGMVKTNSYSSVGRSLGVSDNAVRNHLKGHGYDPRTLKKC